MRILASPARRHHDTRPCAAAAAHLWLAAVGALSGTAAFGQTAVPCTAIADDAERLACYDRALRAPAPAAAPAPAPRATAPATESRAAAPQPTPPPAAAPDQRPRDRRVRDAAAPTPAAPAAPAAPRANTADGEDAVLPIVIVSLRELPGRPVTFVAEDGAAWVQTDSQRIVGLPDTPFAAEIKPGAMGSRFLVPKDRGRAIRVRLADPR